MNKSNGYLGLILVLLGAVLLTNNLFQWTLLSMEYLWPIFVLTPGLVFEWSYFKTASNPGLLVPGGILITIGLLFFFETLTGWTFSAYTWPIYPLSVAIGLFQLYLFTDRPRGLLIPVFILSTVSFVSLSILFLKALQIWVNFGFIAPIVLILAGLFIILRASSSYSQSPSSSKPINLKKRVK